jgi:endonuclease/exonuclease/phosphatase (EEP) superfamily protein YafD
MKKNLLLVFRLLAILTLLIVSLLSLIGYCGTWQRYFELASHFKLQYLEIALICLLALLIMRAWRWASVALICAALNAAVIIPWFYPLSQQSDSRHDLRLLLANVNAGNTNYPALIDLITAESPDIIIVQEAGDAWLQALEQLAGAYPFTRFVANRDHAGISIRSRFPFEPIADDSFGEIDFPLIAARIKLDNLSFSLITLHPPPPITDAFFNERNRQLGEVAQLVRQVPQPAVVAGDLNISLWSPYYKKFCEQSGLKVVRQGFGILPTYPTHNRLMMIPIDHCLVTPDLEVTNCRIGKDVSSDHLPIIVDLVFPD